MGIAFVTSMLIADRTTNDVFHYYEQMYVADADYWVLSDDHTYDEEQISSILKHPDVTGSLLALDKQTFFEVEGDHSLNQRAVRITGVQDQTSSLLKLPVIEGRLDNQGLVIPDVVAKLLNKKWEIPFVFLIWAKRRYLPLWNIHSCFQVRVTGRVQNHRAFV